MLNKINNNIFIKSTLVLLIGGMFGKIIGFILKIMITRYLGTNTMGLYSLLSPTTSLLSVIGVFSYSNAISKLISEKRSDTKKLFVSILPISIIINLIIIIIVILFSSYLSNYLLHESILKLPIICISLTMPFISISAIIKGYFWGKQNMFPYMLSNFIEQVIRLILVLLFLKKLMIYGDKITICFIILINIIGEISSWLVMLKYAPKFKISLKDLKIDFNEVKKIMNFCIPVTLSKIIGSISYFLEPIILTNILLYVGYSENYIVYEYGVINAYSLSLLLMPQFFTQNMSTSLIPELAKYYKVKDYKMCTKRIKQIVIVSLLIGSISTIIITIFPNFFLSLLYNTNEGIDYIRLLSPFTILFYIEYPLVNALQALGEVKVTFKMTIITSLIKILSIIIFSFFKIGMYSLIISIIINLISSTLLYYRKLYHLLKI